MEEKSKEEEDDIKDRIKNQNQENILKISKVIKSKGNVGKFT